MQSFDFRIKVIREYLDQEVLNDDLRKEMNIEFIKKGLSTRVVDAVFGDETPLDSLDEIYHMAILRVINLYTKDDKYNLDNYFSKASVANYITFKSIETEEKSDTILLKNFIYNEDDNSYVGYLSYLPKSYTSLSYKYAFSTIGCFFTNGNKCSNCSFDIFSVFKYKAFCSLSLKEFINLSISCFGKYFSKCVSKSI